MMKFEICYQLDQETFILPELLPIRAFDRFFEEDDCLIFEMYYESFLPSSIFPRLMVHLHHLIFKNKKWRTGMILIEENIFGAMAYIELDKEAKKILIEVSGIKKREFLSLIRKTIQDINSTYSQVECRQLIPISVGNSTPVPIDYNELLGYEKARQDYYFSGLLQKEFKVKAILDNYESAAYRNTKDKSPTRVFVSYASKDHEHKQGPCKSTFTDAEDKSDSDMGRFIYYKRKRVGRRNLCEFSRVRNYQYC